jgi:hypothetical protein
MTGELFNFFYPGYTTSYLSYQGAVGMLYEQGSSRGLGLTRSDGTVRTLADAARQQYTAAWAAARLAAAERDALLRDYVQAHRDALADGARGTRRYLIDASRDPQMAAELAALLARNGIEVGRLAEGVTLSDVRDRAGASARQRSFPAGTYVVEAAQPRNRLVRVLMEAEVPVPQAFLDEARARVDRAENPRFYDITAWSLPLLFNVEAYASGDGRALRAEPVAEEVQPPQPPARQAAYAYLFDGGQTAVPAALHALRSRGHRVAMLTKPTRLGGQDYPSGTGIVYVSPEASGVNDDVTEVARRYRLTARPADTGMAERGSPSLGSTDVIYLRAPRIALLAEEPVQGYSFGWAWHVLDREYELPVTVLRAALAGLGPALGLRRARAPGRHGHHLHRRGRPRPAGPVGPGGRDARHPRLGDGDGAGAAPPHRPPRVAGGGRRSGSPPPARSSGPTSTGSRGSWPATTGASPPSCSRTGCTSRRRARPRPPAGPPCATPRATSASPGTSGPSPRSGCRGGCSSTRSGWARAA